MDRRNALRIIDIGAARDAREWLYKADYPRRIDQDIDFFGTGDTRHGRLQRRAPDPARFDLGSRFGGRRFLVGRGRGVGVR